MAYKACNPSKCFHCFFLKIKPSRRHSRNISFKGLRANPSDANVIWFGYVVGYLGLKQFRATQVEGVYR